MIHNHPIMHYLSPIQLCKWASIKHKQTISLIPKLALSCEHIFSKCLLFRHLSNDSMIWHFTIKVYNVWCNKNRTKHSSVLLLPLVRFLLHQTLLMSVRSWSFSLARASKVPKFYFQSYLRISFLLKPFFFLTPIFKRFIFKN